RGRRAPGRPPRRRRGLDLDAGALMATERKMVNHPTIGAATFSMAPSRFLTYPGDVSHMVREHQLVGPNTLGELWVAVAAEVTDSVDQPAGRKETRVGFAPLQRTKEAS